MNASAETVQVSDNEDTTSPCITCHPLSSRLLASRINSLSMLLTLPDVLYSKPARRPALWKVTDRGSGLKFSHQLHARSGMTCDACHSATKSQSVFPSMAACVSCHEGSAAPVRCDACHQSTATGTLKTHFGPFRLSRPHGFFRTLNTMQILLCAMVRSPAPSLRFAQPVIRKINVNHVTYHETNDRDSSR